MADQEFDVIVVGSGGAGMTAALAAQKQGLSVVIVEKAPHFGGSTARSGGGVWIPMNKVLLRDGVTDTLEEARKYAHSIIGDVVDPVRIDTYIDRGPEVFSFLLDNSPLEMEWVENYADYYPEAPGGRIGGRSCEPIPFDKNRLGEHKGKLEPDYTEAPANMVVKQSDYKWLNLLFRHPRGPLRAAKVAARLVQAKAKGTDMVARGQALMAALGLGVIEAGIPMWLSSPVTDLLSDGNRITGVKILRDVTTNDDGSYTGGEEQVLTAKYGVIMCSGGFENNAEMRKKYQRAPIGSDWTVGVKGNTGEVIEYAIDKGAAVSFMEDAWWGPTIPLKRTPWFALSERSAPGSIMVNGQGKRFMNESLPYVEATHRMYGGEFGQGEGPGENIPAWIMFDQTCRNRYLFAGVNQRMALPGRWYKEGIVVRANTIAELAEKMGVPADSLKDTVQRFNAFARVGVDEDFQRGKSGYDHYYGDPTNKPNPSLGPLEKGPFYACKMVPGDLGTKGGVDTDKHGRALREDKSVIEGLFAAGNCSSPVMGHTYAGPGATIGPAMVFAYLAIEQIAAQRKENTV